MKITGKNGVGDILKGILQICFYGGIVVLIVLPFLLQKVGLHLNASALILYPNGIAILMIVYQFMKLFDSLKNNNPFCEENSKILKNAGIIAVIESFLWLLDLLYEIILVKAYDIIFILAVAFLCVLFLGVSIALYILSELFKEATEYKKENELTI